MIVRVLLIVVAFATAVGGFLERARGDTLLPASGGSPTIGSATAGQVPQACAAPDDLAAPDAALPHVASVVRERGSLDILAVGSATMLGSRGQAAGSYPDRMVALLRSIFPALTIRVTVHGGRGVTAAEMLATLREELSQHRYQLVLWQTATVEAVRNMPPEALVKTLAEGAEQIRLSNADLVLIDPQYSRFLRANANLDPYLLVLQQAGGHADVALFRRYDLMKYWVGAGQIDLEQAAKTDRLKVAEVLHECLAQALARFISKGIEAAQP